MFTSAPADENHRGITDVDRISDNWKKYPLVVIGEPPATLPTAISLPLSELGAPESAPLCDSYILLALPISSLSAALERLEGCRVSPDQVVVFLPDETGFTHPRLPFLGILDSIDGESTEEFRARLLGKLEAQRQKKLLFSLHEASESGLARRLGECELQRTLDTTRVAHALACSFALFPKAHGQILRTCLGGITPANPPLAWTSDTTLDRLICETAAFIVDCASRDGIFRDAVRERAAALPFKTRTELLHHVENCLGLLLGGKSHAA